MLILKFILNWSQGDLSGKLGFDEFKQLWMDLRKWKAVFKQFDRDNSGKLSTYELRDAFHASGKYVIFDRDHYYVSLGYLVS